MTLDLDALERAVAAMTPGTWTANTGGYSTDHPGGFHESAGADEIEPDDAGICALRNAAPALIARVREAEALIARLQDALMDAMVCMTRSRVDIEDGDRRVKVTVISTLNAGIKRASAALKEATDAA